MSPSESNFRRAPLKTAQTDVSSQTIRTIPELIDFHARQNPDHVFCMQSDSSLEGEEFHTVDYACLENAILACQTSILGDIGPACLPRQNADGSIVKSAPVALLMESDLSILLYLFSLFGLGIPVVLLSIRLSPLAIKSLVVETGASIVYTSQQHMPLAKEAHSLLANEKRHPLSINASRSYRQFLNIGNLGRTRVYVDLHHVADDDRNVFILHSSGTTGLPKAIRQSHSYVLNYLLCCDLSDVESQRLNLTSLPLFHGFGLLAPLLSLSLGKSLIIPPSSLQTGAQVVPLLERFKLGSFMTVPVILQELVELNNPSVMEALRSLDFVACAGGALKESVGNMLAAAGVNVLNSYGNTEAGPLSVMYVPPEGYDWRWFMLRDDMGIQMIAEENEACADPNTCRLSVRPPGWTHIFEMQDLFAIDPSDGTKRRLRPLARTDDVIVLKNGEKVSPYTVESILAQRDDVRAAVVFGSGQSQLGVLIEPAQTVLSKQDLDEFRDNILRYLVEARTSIDAHAHIVFREAVVVLKEGQTLFRSDKGALLRRACYETYSQEIGQAYDQLSIGTVDVDGEILRGDVEDNIEKLIRTKILRSGQPTELTRSTDLFELGIDSLQVGQLHRILLSSLSLELGDRHAAERVVPDGFVYLNSTISKMARGLRGESRADDLSSSKEETIQKYIREHEVTPRLAGEQQPRKGAVVLLTGASGGLGSHVLRELVTNDSVEQVICLNRAAPGYADAYTRQYICSSEKGADIPPQFRKKIAILNTKTSDIHLGLQDFIYASLVATVTHVVHNAWPMDLNRQLHSFQPQFQIMSNLLRFCLEAKEWHLNREGFTVRLLFVSSISVVGFYNGKDKSSIEDTGTYHNSSTFLIPEDAPIEALHTLRVGYAEAKLVCERLVRNATNAGIIDGVITRMGQIAGALENGYWNSAEHIPMMMSLSARMGALPKLEGTLSWIPLDLAARSVSTILLLSPSNNPFSPGDNHIVYHIENPQRQKWDSILTPLSKNLNLPLVGFGEWVDLLRSHPSQNHKRPDDTTGNDTTDDIAFYEPLLHFFETFFEGMGCGAVVLGMERAKYACPETLGRIEAISPNLLDKYTEYWKKSGVIASTKR